MSRSPGGMAALSMKSIKFVQYIGREYLRLCGYIGRIILFFYQSVLALCSPPYYWRVFCAQLLAIGFYSIPIVGMTAIFTGIVLALQTYVGFARFSGESAVASVVVISITRELGPVISGLMLAARVGSSMAAEISSMKTSEQLDALHVMHISPYKYVFAPRMLAAAICMPILVFIADVIGVLGGALVSVYQLSFEINTYMCMTMESLQFMDVFSGLVKGAIFGLVVAYAGCFCGYNSDDGARGVGYATINSVMSSCVGILFFNYIVTMMFV